MKSKDDILFSWWNKQNQSKDELSTNDCIIGAMEEYKDQCEAEHKKEIEKLQKQVAFFKKAGINLSSKYLS